LEEAQGPLFSLMSVFLYPIGRALGPFCTIICNLAIRKAEQKCLYNYHVWNAEQTIIISLSDNKTCNHLTT
jgi:hypothetical protein